MKIGLPFIAQVRSADDPKARGGWIAETITALVAQIGGGYHQEHTVDDTHGDVHALTISASAQPRCIAYHNTSQSVTTATFTVLSLNSEDLDVGGFHSTTTNNSRLTVPVGADGFYAITGYSFFGPGVANTLQLAILKNGVRNKLLAVVTGVAATDQMLGGTTWRQLLAGDYIEIQVYQDSGGALPVGSTDRGVSTELTLVKLW